MKVIKVGGSCLAKSVPNASAIAASLAGDDQALIIHGYGLELTGLLNQYGIHRQQFTSLSGIESHFSDELCVSASVFAAALCRHRMQVQLQSLGYEVYAKPAFTHQFASGKRKSKLRYLDDNKVMRSYFDDYSGSIDQLDFSRLPLDKARIILLSPILANQNLDLLVVDADRLSIEAAIASGASELYLMSDVPGLRVNGEYVSEVKLDELATLIENTQAGMQRKLRQIQHALNHGIEQIRIVDGTGTVNEALQAGTTFHA